MQYQLVLQWGAGSVADYDDLIAMEEILLAALHSTSAHVDGHDMGSGQMNIFIWTDRPHQTFAAVSDCLAGRAQWGDVRAAYRPADGDEFTILWPESVNEFTVL